MQKLNVLQTMYENEKCDQLLVTVEYDSKGMPTNADVEQAIMQFLEEYKNQSARA